MPERDPATGRFPKRPSTSAGPKGGKGWGGPANGQGAPQFAAGDAWTDHVRALSRDPRHAEAKAALRELYLRTLVDVAVTAPESSARVAAADKLADRVDGKARQAVEQSGPDGGPIQTETKVTVRIVRPEHGGPGGV